MIAGAFPKNVAVNGLPFYLEDRVTGDPITTGAITIYIVIDDGLIDEVAGDGAAVHKGQGLWTVDLTQAEMNGDVIGLLVTHGSARPVPITIRTGVPSVTLEDDAITSAKFDESTAFPMTSADTLARTGSVVESQGSITLQQAISVILAAVAGVSENDGTDFKTPNGVSTRINSTVSGKNRTAVTLTPSS